MADVRVPQLGLPLADDTALVADLAQKSDLLLVKKLSVNDRDWAWTETARAGKKKHQNGVYIPPRERDGGFFPPLSQKSRTDSDAAEIREAFFETYWPQLNERRESRLVHYTSKVNETHLTRIPREAFSDLSPASLLVIGRVRTGITVEYSCITIDATSDAAEWLAQTFPLPPDFVAQVFEPAEFRKREIEGIRGFIDEAMKAFVRGEIVQFAASHAAMPDTDTLARLGRERYMSRAGITSLDPFSLPNPGDVLRQISRGDEYELFKELQLRARALQLLTLIVGTDPRKASVEKVIENVIQGYGDIDAALLSASQQRRSRAGYSFEHHIEHMLRDGAIPYEKQVIIEARKRPDFVLPSLLVFRDKDRRERDALILSAKTTLRERWKQVHREKQLGAVPLFLATVDESIAGNAIADMASLGIVLVVPESLKRPSRSEKKTTEYQSHTNVIDFRTFFDEEIRRSRLGRWRH